MARRTKEIENEIVMPETEMVEVEQPIEAVVNTIEEPRSETVGITKTCVNIRKTPDSESEIVGVLFTGSTVNILNKTPISGFYKIKGGYVMADYLEFKER